MSKYVKVDDLQAYCDNQIDHSITPNVFQRMEHIEIVRCKDCKRYYANGGNCDQVLAEWFCADGERK